MYNCLSNAQPSLQLSLQFSTYKVPLPLHCKALYSCPGVSNILPGGWERSLPCDQDLFSAQMLESWEDTAGPLSVLRLLDVGFVYKRPKPSYPPSYGVYCKTPLAAIIFSPLTSGALSAINWPQMKACWPVCFICYSSKLSSWLESYETISLVTLHLNNSVDSVLTNSGLFAPLLRFIKADGRMKPSVDLPKVFYSMENTHLSFYDFETHHKFCAFFFPIHIWLGDY